MISFCLLFCQKVALFCHTLTLFTQTFYPALSEPDSITW
jgi:hypothetical protein